MSEKASWLDIGYEANERIMKEQQDVQESKKKEWGKPRRFWLLPKESTTVILCDDDPKCTFEYDVCINGKWGNFFTCTRRINGEDLWAPHTEKIQMKRSYMGFLTVIDETEYVAKNGTTYSHNKKVLPLTSKSIEAFKTRKANRGGSLVGCKFSVTRTDADKSLRIGDVWDFLETVDLSTIKNAQGEIVDTTPVNYEEFLAPRPKAEILEILASMGVGETSSTEVEIPF